MQNAVLSFIQVMYCHGRSSVTYISRNSSISRVKTQIERVVQWLLVRYHCLSSNNICFLRYLLTTILGIAKPLQLPLSHQNTWQRILSCIQYCCFITLVSVCWLINIYCSNSKIIQMVYDYKRKRKGSGTARQKWKKLYCVLWWSYK